ncbi:MAG: hypothetical protein Q4D29_09990 [Lachnospiraceae bacterium]|nr:hypothetical protein [Lachnospiraceae bacterium]
MSKFLRGKLAKSLAILAIASLVFSSICTPIMADDVPPASEGFVDPVLPPNGEGFIDPVLPPTGNEPGPVNPCANGHDFHSVVIKEPTCTESGITRYECSRCNYFEEDTNNPQALGHQADGGVKVKDPTCTEAGAVQYTCVRCGADMGSQQIPALGHEQNAGETHDATCTETGSVHYTCVRCGADMGSQTIPAKGHTEDGGTVVKQPTTTTPGEIEYKCVRCGIVLREEQIPVIGKREVPQAVFATDSCNLTNIPENSSVKVNGNTVSDSATGSVNLNGLFPQSGDYTITVVANGNAEKGASDPQAIHTHKPNAPSHLQAIDEPANGGTGAIGGVDTSMEYTLADQNNWFMCTSSSQPVSAGIYIVRYKATSTSVASDPIEVLVKKASQQKPATPTATFDGPTHQLRNLSEGMVYSTNGGDTWTKVSNAAVTLSNDAVLQAVSYKSIVVKNIVQGVESDIQTVQVGRVPQPNGVSTTPATNGSNGSIKGVWTDMQYIKEGGEAWIDIGSDTVSGLAKGKYFVRRKAAGNLIESNPIDVKVDDKQGSSKEGKPSATFNAYNMHIDGVSGCRLSFDGGKNWTDKIKDSTYVVNESYVNTTNGIIVYRQGNGSTTSDSDRQYITLTKQPTPSGITATSATPTIPGCIVGTDVSMQYRAVDQTSWVDVTGNTVAVAAGTYYLRRHGYGNSLPSDWLTIVIKANVVVEPTTPTKVVPIENTKPKTEAQPKEEPKKEEVKQEPKEEKKEPVAEEAPAIVVENNIPASGGNEPVSATGETGWQAIETTFETATDAVVINLNEATLIPADVIVKAAETDTPIVLETMEGASWSILPSDVRVNEITALSSVDLGIINDSVNIPEAALLTVEDSANDQVVSQTFDIKHEGNFGFKADLTMKVKDGTPGQYANLYTYNPFTGKLEFIDSSVIDESGHATFKMSHASSYVIVKSKEAMSQDSVKEVSVEQVTNDEPVADNNKTEVKEPAKKKVSPVTIGLIVVIIVLIIALVAILYYQKNGPLDAGKKKRK